MIRQAMSSTVLALALCVLPAGCSVTRVTPENIRPKATVSGGFPVPAHVSLYVAPSQGITNIEVRYGYGQRADLTPGLDMYEASAAIARRYFRDVVDYAAETPTHYVLRISGDADLDMVWGNYTGRLEATLFNADGTLLAREEVRSGTLSTVINDQNAFYNSYADAMRQFLDKVFAAEGERIAADVRARAPARPSFSGTAMPPGVSVVGGGSGFFVNQEGDVVTNRHVVTRCLGVSVRRDGRDLPAEIAWADAATDIAVLRTRTPAARHARIHDGATPLPLGVDVLTLGFPLPGVLASSPNLTSGSVSGLRGLNDDADRLQMSAPIQPGNSGGPLLDRAGRVVGVVQSTLDARRVASATGGLPQNVNFAIATPALRRGLDEAKVTYTAAPSDEVPARAPPDVADEASQYTVQVNCRG